MEFGTIKRRGKQPTDDPNYPEITGISDEYRAYAHNVNADRARLRPQKPLYAYDDYDPEETDDSERRRKQLFTTETVYGKEEQKPLPQRKYIAALNRDYYGTRSEVNITPTLYDSVYGEKDGQPLEGPVSWQHYYTDWNTVGHVVQGGEPLEQPEIDFCGKYGITFVRNLGAGSFGAVYECNYSTFDAASGTGRTKKLACKVQDIGLHKPDYTPQAAVEKMVHEVNILRDLSHPNLVSFEGMFHVHHPMTGFPTLKLLMFMPLCEGDLSHFIYSQPSQRLTEDQAKVVMKQLCKGLKYLHKQNVVHFDIKPDNVLYVTDPTSGERVYKFTDFGLAQRFENKRALATDAGGTPDYYAPEIANAPEFEPKRADIYSLGVTLCEMVIGSDFDSFVVVLRKAKWPPDRIEKQHYLVTRRVGFEVLDLIRRMTSMDPMDRPKISQVKKDKWFRT